MKAKALPWARIIAEFFVIFLGVTLSLAADDWLQNREDRGIERVLLQELTADLQADSLGLSDMQDRMRDWDEAAVWLWRFGEVTSTSADAGLEQALRLLTITNYQPVASAYTSLKDGGQLSLVTDPKLRRQIIEYYEVDQAYILQLEARVKEYNDDLTLAVRPHIGFTVAEGSNSFWPLGPVTIKTSWRELISDHDVKWTIEYLGTWAGSVTTNIEQVLSNNAVLRRSINETLEEN